jgi:hypothetical protein
MSEDGSISLCVCICACACVVRPGHNPLVDTKGSPIVLYNTLKYAKLIFLGAFSVNNLEHFFIPPFLTATPYAQR